MEAVTGPILRGCPMTRHMFHPPHAGRLLAFTLILLWLMAPSPLSAQTPPSDRDLQIYAGLHAAAAHGDVAEIERLVAKGEKPDLQDSNSRTPLIVAAFRKQHAAARALLRLGANPNAFDSE